MADETQPIICAHCRRSLAQLGRFEITRVAANGDHRSTVHVCSLICLCQWGYGAAVSHGVAGVVAVKDTLSNMAAMFRGPPKAKKR